jgi:hypothetical protein
MRKRMFGLRPVDCACAAPAAAVDLRKSLRVGDIYLILAEENI